MIDRANYMRILRRINILVGEGKIRGSAGPPKGCILLTREGQCHARTCTYPFCDSGSKPDRATTAKTGVVHESHGAGTAIAQTIGRNHP